MYEVGLICVGVILAVLLYVSGTIFLGKCIKGPPTPPPQPDSCDFKKGL